MLALEADMKSLSERAVVIGEPTALGSRRIHRLQIGPHRVYAVIMGSGCVETAVSAEALLTRFRCDVAFSLGPAGGLAEPAAPGRWFYVGECVVRGKSAGPGSRGQPLVIPDVPNEWKVGAPLEKTPKVVLTAGEVFVNQRTQRDSLAASTGALLVDMNTHGLHAACANHRLPLHVWRVVSDMADEEAGQRFREFVQAYDGAGGRALAALIRELPANPNAAGSYSAIQKLIKPQEGGESGPD